MIVPTKIEAHWIGSITHAVIEPASTGITVLDGHTGSGKSSLMNAIVWVLYGQVGGVGSFNRQGALRSDHCPDGEVAWAAVEFSWGDAHYRAERRLRRSKSGKETAAADLYIDGQKQPTMSPDKLTSKIEALTGMTGRAFVSSYFIPQNHLVRLAEGTPSEVQNIIEDQTGLGMLTAQIADAARVVADRRRDAESRPGSPEAVAELASALTAAKSEAQAAEASAAAATDAEHLATTQWTEAAQTTATLRQRRDLVLDAARDVALCDGHIAQLDTRRTQLEADLESVPAVGDVADLEAERANLRRLVQQIAHLSAENNSCAQQLETAQQDGTRAAAELQELAEPAEVDIDGPRNALAELQVRIKAAEASVVALSTTNNSHTCPTCTQTVSDTAQLLDAVRSGLAKDKAAVAAAQAAVAAAEAVQAQNQQLATRRSVLTQRRDDARTRWVVATADKKRIAEDCHTLLASAQKALLPHTAPARLGECSDELDRRIDTLSGHLNAAHRRATIDGHLADVDRDKAEWTRRRDQQIKVASTTVDETAIADAAALEQQAATRRAAAAAAAAQEARESAVAAAALADITRRHTEQQRLLAAKQEALTAADVAQHAHNVLVAYRKELLAQYTDAVSEAASEVMEQAGGGRHVAVAVDHTFAPRVVLADGRSRPVKECSGGEKLRAALALCLGQAAQHTPPGGAAGMLFADEIATGYDAATTAAVMDMIAQLGRPVLMVGHNPEVRQIAQKVYEFTNLTDQGTRVTEAGTPAATRADVTDAVAQAA